MPAVAPKPPVKTAPPGALTWGQFTERVPFDEFARRTLENGLNDRAAMMIANYGEEQSGLTGKVQQLYRVLFHSMRAGPAAPRE